MGLLRDLLHLHELVNGNLAFISARRVLLSPLGDLFDDRCRKEDVDNGAVIY